MAATFFDPLDHAAPGTPPAPGAVVRNGSPVDTPLPAEPWPGAAPDPLDDAGPPAGWGIAGRSVAAARRRRAASLAVDVTSASGAGRALVLAARPGDEVLGCGALIARKRAAGTDVVVAVVTDGRHLRRSRVLPPAARAARLAREATEAAGMLGVGPADVHHLGFEEGALHRGYAELVAAVAKLLGEVGPDELLVPAMAELDASRRAVYDAAWRAVADHAPSTALLAYHLDAWAAPSRRLVGRSPGLELVRAERFRYLKEAAAERLRSRTANLTGEACWAVLPPATVAALTGDEEVLRRVVVDQGRAGRQPADVAGPRWAAERLARRGALPGGVVDYFEGFLAPGEVVGSPASSGARRGGVDAEGVLAVAGGRLRLGHLQEPGWGRQGVAYGPFERRDGLAFTARVLNSHHNAHRPAGPRTPRAVLGHLRRGGLAGVPALAATFRRPALEENLLVGFHEGEVPTDPSAAAAAFVVRAAGAVNGELRATVGGRRAPLVDEVLEVPLTYVVVLRERGATYYLSGLGDVPGVAPWPMMRPVAVDVAGDERLLHAGVHQAVHAEDHYELTSTVDEVRVAEVGLGCEGLLAADPLGGLGELAGSPAAVGGPWSAAARGLHRTEAGAVADGAGAAGRLDLDEPAGLLLVSVRTSAVLAEDAWAGLCFRGEAGAEGPSGWQARVGRDVAELAVAVAGRWRVVARGAAHLPAAHRASLQVLDDGRRINVLLDGQQLFGGWVDDARHSAGRAVGVLAGPGSGLHLQDFEAHPRQVRVPLALQLGDPWDRRGDEVVGHDRFQGGFGDLAAPGRAGAPAWERTLGPGRLVLADGALRVDADRHRPNPGRTLYTVPWPHPGFAELEVVLEPPGRARSQGHGSRGGLVFYDDEDNYLVVNVWVDDSPTHDGSAVSLFLRSAGHEREANALWANVGRRVRWGRRTTLSAASDGDHVLVRLDGEPVLHRRVGDVYATAEPLRLRRVGLAVNREWGDDTGTRFHEFTARRSGEPR